MQVEVEDFIGTNVSKLDDFTKGYLAAILCTSDDVEKRSRLPSKSGLLETKDLSDDAIIDAYQDCKKFQEENSGLLEEAYTMYGYEQKQAGIDFWLTRNHHGAGFWDRDHLETLKNDLTDACRKWSEKYVSVYKKRLHIE